MATPSCRPAARSVPGEMIRGGPYFSYRLCSRMMGSLFRYQRLFAA
jgi:hypothetical protein